MDRVHLRLALVLFATTACGAGREQLIEPPPDGLTNWPMGAVGEMFESLALDVPSIVKTAGELTPVDLAEAGLVDELERLGDSEFLAHQAIYSSGLRDDGTNDWWNASLADRDVLVRITFHIASPRHVDGQPAGLPVEWTTMPAGAPPYARTLDGTERYVGRGRPTTPAGGGHSGTRVGYHVSHMRADVYARIYVTTYLPGQSTERGRTVRAGTVDFWRRDELADLR